MSDFKVLKGVPLPEAGRTRKLYPFDTMDIGDSFEFPNKLQTSVRGAFQNYIRKHNPHAEFVTRKVNATTCACWRIK